MRINLNFFALQLIFFLGIFFTSNSYVLYLSVIILFAMLLRQKYFLKSPFIFFGTGFIVMNVIFQAALGFLPNFKSLLNFFGYLFIMYSVLCLIPNRKEFNKFLFVFARSSFVVASFFTISAIVGQGWFFYTENLNYSYSYLGKLFEPFTVVKQIIGPFLFITACLSLASYSRNNLINKLLLGVLTANIFIFSFGSRSVVLGILFTLFLLIFKNYFKNILNMLFIYVVILFLGIFLMENYFEYFNLIQLYDVRGVVYLGIMQEIIDHPYGVGFGNAVDYITQNNPKLYSSSYIYFSDLQNTNSTFSGFSFRDNGFPINIESSFLIWFLEQGLILTSFVIIFISSKISQMLENVNKIEKLFTFGFGVVFFTSFSQDNLLLIPYIFYLALFIKFISFKVDKHNPKT